MRFYSSLLFLQLLLITASPALAQQAPAGPQEVQALRLTPRDVTVNQDLPGRVAPFEIAEIRPQVTGIITERLFEEGARVEAGQQLYQIDPAPYQAAHDRAVADLQRAKAVVKPLEIKEERFRDLVKIEAISKQEYDDVLAQLGQARAEIAVAEAAVTKARIDLDYTKVYAPISGMVGKSMVTRGALVTANQMQPMAVAVRLDPVYVDVTASSEDLVRLRQRPGGLRDLPVTLLLDQRGSVYPHEGRSKFHEFLVDEDTGAVKLRTLFPNPDHDLLPGLFVQVRFSLAHKDTLVVPQRAAQRRADGLLGVLVVDQDGVAQRATFTESRSVNDLWLVKDGLKPGDILITQGGIGLQPGTPVKPVFPQAADDNGQAGGE